MHRFFTNDIGGGKAVITGEDVRHLNRVLRLRPGETVQLCDGRGTDYDGVIETVTDEKVFLSVGAGYPSRSESLCRITLFQCLPKTGKMETIVQKCTELGVDGVVPVFSKRCVALPSSNFDIKKVRYQRVAEEAAKQSRRGMIPQFSDMTPIAALKPASFDLFLVCYEEEHTLTLKKALKGFKPGKSGATLGLLVGPEGGLTPEETDRLKREGALSISLGPRILRTETAGMAAIAQILFEVDR